MQQIKHVTIYYVENTMLMQCLFVSLNIMDEKP